MLTPQEAEKEAKELADETYHLFKCRAHKDEIHCGCMVAYHAHIQTTIPAALLAAERRGYERGVSDGHRKGLIHSEDIAYRYSCTMDCGKKIAGEIERLEFFEGIESSNRPEGQK